MRSPVEGAPQAQSTTPASAPSAGGRPLAPDQAARWFIYSAVLWFLVAGLVGLLLAAFLYTPNVQSFIPEPWRGPLNFGRLRPMHVNVLLFGWLSMLYAAAFLYLTPRLTSTPLWSERLARWTCLLWNLLMLGAVVSLPLGFTQGREYAELVWPLDLLQTALFLMLALNVWGTVLRRREPRLYVSVWNFMAASLIIALVYAFGNKIWDVSGAYVGMNDAIVNYFYVHNLFNVWFTTGGLGIALYLIPRLSGNPLFSHRLAIWGFASVWAGQHHLLYAPGPDWLEFVSIAFSILAAIPNTAFGVNFVMTMRGAWHRVTHDVPLAWVATGASMYLLTCAQGVAQSFRDFSLLVHFTNWVIGHSHLVFVGAYSAYGFALVYHLLGRIDGARFDPRLQWWHYGLTMGGLWVFLLTLWSAGLIQGQNWATGAIPFLATVRSLQPYHLVRLLAGLIMAVGQLLFAYQVWRAFRGRASAETA